MNRICAFLLLVSVGCSPSKVNLGIDSSASTVDTTPPALGVHANEYCSQKAGDFICNLVLKNQNDQGFRGLIDYSYDNGYAILSWPTFLFVDRNLKIYGDMSGFSEAAIRQKIEEKI